MGRSVFESVLGAIVLAIAALFLSFAYKSADLQKVVGYNVSANFPMVDGLKEGARLPPFPSPSGSTRIGR